MFLIILSIIIYLCYFFLEMPNLISKLPYFIFNFMVYITFINYYLYINFTVKIKLIKYK